MTASGYRLDENVGFILRQVTQRHVGLFVGRIPGGLTPMQFAVLAKLHELGPTAQTRLGRRTAMDAATVKGVVDRLERHGLVLTESDPGDARRVMVALTGKGRALAAKAVAAAERITEATLAPLAPEERVALLGLLRRLL